MSGLLVARAESLVKRLIQLWDRSVVVTQSCIKLRVCSNVAILVMANGFFDQKFGYSFVGVEMYPKIACLGDGKRSSSDPVEDVVASLDCRA